MIYITGDTHRDFRRIARHCERFDTTKDDLMIILGDSGINHFGHERDRILKEDLEELPITFMLVRGNHEMRPDPQYYTEELIMEKEYKGFFMVEPDFPSLRFAIDGERYLLNEQWANVYGGAYSVDKPADLEGEAYKNRGYYWFPDEQLSETELRKFYQDLLWSYTSVEEERPDLILSHTCPYRHIPREMFLPWVNQSEVDNTMELWFNLYEDLLPPEVKWYCGHWHTDKTDGRMRFLFNDIIAL